MDVCYSYSSSTSIFKMLTSIKTIFVQMSRNNYLTQLKVRKRICLKWAEGHNLLVNSFFLLWNFIFLLVNLFFFLNKRRKKFLVPQCGGKCSYHCNKYMLTLESQRLPVLGEVFFCLRTLPNRKRNGARSYYNILYNNNLGKTIVIEVRTEH